MVTGDDPASLERRRDDEGFVVDLPPRHVRVALGRGDGCTDEADTSRAVGGSFELLDDRRTVRRWVGHVSLVW